MKDQIQKLRTLLQSVIDIHAKSTGGEWFIRGNMIHGKSPYVAEVYHEANAIFITTAHKLDPKMAKGLLDLLNYIEKECVHAERSGRHAVIIRHESTLQSLLTLFAKELDAMPDEPLPTWRPQQT